VGNGTAIMSLRPTRGERGAALITALLIAALAALVASQLLARQSHDLARMSAAADSRQMQAYLAAGFEWARAALTADRATSSTDHAGEAWATPMVAAVESAAVAGVLVDAAGRFNVNNIISTNSDVDFSRYRRLLASLGLPAELADALRDYIDRNNEGAFEESYYLSQNPPQRIPNQALVSEAELARIHGYSPAVLARLLPHVVALPLKADQRPTDLNVNTAGAIVLAAYTDAPRDLAERVVAAREAKPFTHPDELRKLLNRPDTPTNTGVRSDFFLADFSVTQGDAARYGRALIARGADGQAHIIRFEPK
jgi:general secretion pathway protein K